MNSFEKNGFIEIKNFFLNNKVEQVEHVITKFFM